MSENSPEIPLEPAPVDFNPVVDPAKKLNEPIAVRLVSVADVTLLTLPGLHPAMDAFYGGLIGLQIESPGQCYRADNFRLNLKAVAGPIIERDDYRPILIQIMSLSEMEKLLVAREISYERVRGLYAGLRTFRVNDPAGNIIELMEARRLI